jgi:trimeric autotransporter adhesin
MGFGAVERNTTGTQNTGIGSSALYLNTTGGNNVAIGSAAGYDITTGCNNLALGNDAGRAASPSGAITTQSNRIVLGNNSVTNAYVKVAWTVTSDLRDKTNFGTVPHGLDFVNKLEPVSFQFKKSRDNDTPHGDVRYGFKAQDIMALEGDNPVIIDNEQPDHLKYNGEALVPVLVNAVKELTKKIELLESK